MLTPHRRHSKACEHASKGWNYTLCGCPIWCDGTLEGRRFRKSLDTTSWDRALRRIQRLEQGQDVDFLEGSGRTVASAIRDYLADAAARHLKAASLRSYRRTMEALSTFLGTLPLAQLDVGRLAKFRERRESSPRTQRKEIEYLRAFCSFCISRGWIDKNPAKALRLPLIDVHMPTKPYTAEEIRKLMAACDQLRGMWKTDTPAVQQRSRALILCLLYSGLRVGDVAQLKRSELLASNHIVRKTQKKGVPVKILLSQEVADALRSLPYPSGVPTYFFWSGHGETEVCAKSLWRSVHRVGVIAGIHAYPHRFRDTFAVELLTNGTDIRTVQQLLGHESLRTTEKHYSHFVAAHQARLDSATTALNFGAKPARPTRMSRSKPRGGNA